MKRKMVLFTFLITINLCLLLCSSAEGPTTVTDKPVLFSNSSEINATTKHVVLQGPVSYWKSIAVQNGLLLITAVLLMLLVIVGFRYVRSGRRKKMTVSRKYARLNTEDNLNDEVEMSIYEKK